MSALAFLYNILGGLERRKGRLSRTPGFGEAATVTTYNAPSGSPVSSLFTVSANSQQTACYATDIEGHFANFTMTPGGYVDVRVVCATAPTTATVHPAKHSVTPVITGNTVTFRIEDSGNYVLVLNSNWVVPVWIFANPPINVPSPSEVTYYYGPGYYNGTFPNGTSLGTNKRLTLTAGQSVYVDGGAFINGKLQLGPMASDSGATVSGMHVSGYGVFDSTGVTTGEGPGRPLQVGNALNSSIKGPTFVGHTHWGGIVVESDEFYMENLKMINYLDPSAPNGTPDGLDIIGSKNVTYQSCFIRAHDDSIAIKTWKNGFGPSPFWRGNVENVLVQDCVFQQGDGGNGLEIGYENFNNTTNTATAVEVPGTSTPIQFVRNITYRRCDIVRKEMNPTINYRCAALGIHLVDDVPVSNVLYEDVNIEHVERADAWLWFGSFYTSDYSYGNTRAQITGITLRRVNFMSGNFASPDPNPGEIHLQGGGGGKTISNITFENVYVKGSKLVNTNTIAGKVQWNVTNTDGITFI